MTRGVFESIPKQDKVGKKAFKALQPELRQQLVTIQQELRAAKVPVMVLFAGVDGAGKSETVNLLNAWMDPRWVLSHAYSSPTEEEAQRPPFWRYWRHIPAKGQIAMYLSAWYSKPLLDRVRRTISQEHFEAQLTDIAAFERSLQDNGILLLKFWMHLDKQSQKKRLEELSSSPETEWRVKPGAWENWGLYDRFIDASETIVKHSEKAGAPWHLINGSQENARTLQVFRILLASIQVRLKQDATRQATQSDKDWDAAMKKTRGALGRMDLTPTLKREKYNQEMKTLRRKLVQLQHQAQVADLSTVLVFEGQDAAGKGGAIRRLVKGLAAQKYQVIPIAAPTDEELARHYLWRFWRHLPRRGRVTIFDRSWYGRVLVERIEGFAQPAEWQRAYQEINEFESQLTQHGMIICKFWIQIDKAEQLRRFNERTNTPYKQWKITDEDWRNRKRWDAYTTSVEDMVALTHQPKAPWTLVSGNDKLHARMTVLRTVCEQLENALARVR